MKKGGSQCTKRWWVYKQRGTLLHIRADSSIVLSHLTWRLPINMNIEYLVSLWSSYYISKNHHSISLKCLQRHIQSNKIAEVQNENLFDWETICQCRYQRSIIDTLFKKRFMIIWKTPYMDIFVIGSRINWKLVYIFDSI